VKIVPVLCKLSCVVLCSKSLDSSRITCITVLQGLRARPTISWISLATMIIMCAEDVVRWSGYSIHFVLAYVCVGVYVSTIK